MTADAHTEALKEKAVQDVVSAGNFGEYRDALYKAFHIRFVEGGTPMLVTNIKAWVNDQISACRHAYPQDQACTN